MQPAEQVALQNTEDMGRPDFSDYLAHFTRDGDPTGGTDSSNPGSAFSSMTAIERLQSILEGRRIGASSLPWVNRLGVCFTECPWASLIDHAERYSPYGLGFAKPRIFAAGGGPAYYVRADYWTKQVWDDHVKAFVTPFWPSYRAAGLKAAAYLGGKTVDYSHEREWRIPHDFTFEYSQVEFVILNTYEDMAKFPRVLKDSIGREKFLIMDVYRTVEKLWPVHV